jgi:hypothetical protein
VLTELAGNVTSVKCDPALAAVLLLISDAQEVGGEVGAMVGAAVPDPAVGVGVALLTATVPVLPHAMTTINAMHAKRR